MRRTSCCLAAACDKHLPTFHGCRTDAFIRDGELSFCQLNSSSSVILEAQLLPEKPIVMRCCEEFRAYITLATI